MSEDGRSKVLVTGISGFVGLHCALELLKRGFAVRGTLRSTSRGDRLREALADHVDTGGRLEFVQADLTVDDGWAEAVSGCTYVLHVASPLPRDMPKHEDDLIVPARDGVLRVLEAAAASSETERVVMTSSVASIVYGHDDYGDRIFTEDDWSNVDRCPPYPKSKTLAERAAWEFVESLDKDQGGLELVAINPGIIFGPLLEEDWGTSGELVRKLMAREMPGCPPIGYAPVDVRDVASAHVDAMLSPEAAGKRFCCALEHAWVRDIAAILHEHLGERGFRIPQRSLPGFVLRIAAVFDKSVRVIVPELGKREDLSNERAKNLLGWNPRSLDEMISAMADSMIEHGVVAPPAAATRSSRVS